MPLPLQEYLRGGNTLASLMTSPYKLKMQRHRDYTNLILFKYDQIESDFNFQLVRESRGIILDEQNDWEVVCRPFDKFFNIGEGLAHLPDWESKDLKVYEKLDGSLCNLYYYNDCWCVATSGSPDASGTVSDFGFTFAQLFWDTFEKMGLELPDKLLSDFTFMFELTAPWNKVVVPHKESKLTLIGLRNRVTGEDITLPSRVLEYVDYPIVRSFPLKSLDEVAQATIDLNPNGIEQEGFVIWDGNGRVKVKNLRYVAVHHLKDGFGKKRALEIVRTGETSEVLVHFPEWTSTFQEITKRLGILEKELEAYWEKAKDASSQKTFAFEVVLSRCPDALFALRKGQVSTIKEYLAKMRLDSLFETLHLEDINLINDNKTLE